ncbi:methionyl-tRNA formyltransferase [Polaromonas aquatica]|uniref:methionyl-tRNA formyltransferase n=1 Tax=Polaromonas aquatica TaxID=332657 RepID=UPI003D65C3C3
MRVSIIGRTEILFETAKFLRKNGHEIVHIITAKEAPEYTKTAEDFRILAAQWDVPFIQSGRIEGQEAFIRRDFPDICVSVNYSSVIPNSVIELFPLGILNAHGGDLPRYRGNACQAWAIINGEDKVGLCIHRMIGGELDSGDIVARDYFPLCLDTKVTAVYQWMNERIPDLFLDALNHLGADPNFVLETQSKDPGRALRCYPRKPEDGRIDWGKSAVEILRLINACNKPYAGAFCNFETQKIIVWDAELAPAENFLAIPGQVTLIGEGFVEVATGVGKLRLKEIESPNGEKMPNQLVRSIRQRFA